VRQDPPGSLRSPGTLAHLLLMQTLAPRGITAYDFLRGASTYKTRLATRERRLVALRVWRRTLRSTTQQSLRLAARITRRGVRAFLPGHVGR
jgi:CelD/BcsL family acetyltransferase involved in cellulose biosynthesis